MKRRHRLSGLLLASWLGAAHPAPSATGPPSAGPSAPTLVPKAVRIGDVELHYEELGTGVPVVFVHGGVDDYRSFEPQLEPLARSYRAITYSRRHNFPNVQAALSAGYSAIVDADDLAGLLDSLGARPAHLVGHSYGAYAVLILALKHPELVRSIVLVEPPLMRWLPDLPGGRELYDDFMKAMWEPAGRAFTKGDPEQAMRVTIDWFGKNGYVLAGQPARWDTLPAEVRAFIMENSAEWHALTTSSDAFPIVDRAAVTAIHVPVLLMSGEKSLKVNQLVDAELARLLPAAEAVTIAGATHEMWAEKPDECRERALAFFAKH